MITLDTPGEISMWVLLSRMHQLALEINTGMKYSRGSVLADVQRQGWTKARTKKAALQDLVDLMLAIDPDFQISPETIGKALK